MFNNIGKKIKTLAKVCCWIEIIFCIITAISCFAQAAEIRGQYDDYYYYVSSTEAEIYVTIGLTVLFVGPLLAWIMSFFAYGYGQLIDNSDILVEKIGKSPTEANKPNAPALAYNGNYPKLICQNCQKEASNLYSTKMKDGRVLKLCPECYDSIENHMEKKQKTKAVVVKGARIETGTCETCGKHFVGIAECQVSDEYGTRFKKICAECIRKYNSDI